jgi:hypothetical protein
VNNNNSNDGDGNTVKMLDGDKMAIITTPIATSRKP